MVTKVCLCLLLLPTIIISKTKIDNKKYFNAKSDTTFPYFRILILLNVEAEILAEHT